LDDVATYFGPAAVEVSAEKATGNMIARVSCRSKRAPRRVEIRLPHPDALKPREVSGGKQVADTESVVVEPFEGEAEVAVSF